MGNTELGKLVGGGGASQGRSALLLRLKESSQVEMLRINCPLESGEFLSDDWVC